MKVFVQFMCVIAILANVKLDTPLYHNEEDDDLDFDHRFDYDFDEIDKYDEFEEDPEKMPLEDENDYKYDNKEEEDGVFESPLVDEQEEAEGLTEETAAADGREVKELGDYHSSINLPAHHRFIKVV